jgi:hypothetical protein
MEGEAMNIQSTATRQVAEDPVAEYCKSASVLVSAAEAPDLARKRRMELRSKRASDAEEPYAKLPRLDETMEETVSMPPLSISGIKKKCRYEPVQVAPMSKAQLSAWRKEARRVRNRESAAMSRQKTKERIDELEVQVQELQSKYESALQHIAQLESHSKRQFPVDLCPTVTISPPLSPRQSISLDDEDHVMPIPFVPTAVWLPKNTMYATVSTVRTLNYSSSSEDYA